TSSSVSSTLNVVVVPASKVIVTVVPSVKLSKVSALTVKIEVPCAKIIPKSLSEKVTGLAEARVPSGASKS
ncbi:hypothetical protein HOB94_02605, partial [bacterium]|nr:hypothetical protein [bacterium]